MKVDSMEILNGPVVAVAGATTEPTHSDCNGETSETSSKKRGADAEPTSEGCGSTNADQTQLSKGQLKRMRRAAEKKALLEKQALTVAWEDHEIVVVVKPQGMPTIGGTNSLAASDGLMKHSYPRLQQPTHSTELQDHPWQPRPFDALGKARPVHRLDAATGGLVVCGKRHQSVVQYSALFSEKGIQKRYRAIVFGRMSAEDGRIEFPILGKASASRWSLVNVSPSGETKDGFISTVDLWPETGRTHQLRKHMAAIGHPIWGDVRYNRFYKRAACVVEGQEEEEEEEEGEEKTSRDMSGVAFTPALKHACMCLFALELRWRHPSKNTEMVASIEEPQWYADLRACEAAGDTLG